MCNLYRMTKNTDEVARWFDLVDADGGANGAGAGANLAQEVYPGYPCLVFAQGCLIQMSWGFPLVMKGKSGQPLKPKPVNNARTDKLDSFFWSQSFAQRRCLIPLTAWAEAQGAKGAKTRTWMACPDAGLFAVAGVWRDSDEFGRCYAMVMTNSDGSACADIHSRMPVLLRREDFGQWVQGSPDAAKALCTAWTGDLVIKRTDDPWVRGKAVQRDLF